MFVFQKIQVDEYFGPRRLTSQDRLGSVGIYYPYGEATSGSVSNADSFATYYRDSTGLDYADQRAFVPAAGRFLTPDPVGNGHNWYSYTEGDPINGNDPSGLVTCGAIPVLNSSGNSLGTLSQVFFGSGEASALGRLIWNESRTYNGAATGREHGYMAQSIVNRSRLLAGRVCRSGT